PASSAERTLDGHRRLDRDGGPLEDREELVGAGVDLAAPRTRYRRPEDAADVVQQVAVAVAQLIEEGGGGLDIRHQQGYEPGGEGRRIGGCRLDLTVSTLFFDGKAHGGQHGLREIRIVENGRIVHERRHGPALALEIGHHARVPFGGERDRLPRAVQVRSGCVRPVEDGQGRVPENAAQALFEFAGCPVPTQLDHETTGRRVFLLVLQLAGDEPDRHNAVLLCRVQESPAGALPRRIVLEGDLIEPGERVPHVRCVVDRQPPLAVSVDVGEGAIWEAGPLGAVEPGHVPTIPRWAGHVNAAGRGEEGARRLASELTTGV